jgi:membrane protein DedA with SNARE-associated domain
MVSSIYSHLAIAVIVLIAAFGAPLPVASMLTAAGVLAANGKMNIATLVIVSSVAAIAGDGLGYVLGRFGLRWFAKWAAARPARGSNDPVGWLRKGLHRLVESKSMRQAAGWSDAMLARRGSMGILIVLTRTVLAAFGPFVNVLSGVRRYHIGRFFLYDALGELAWVGMYVGIGYVAGIEGDGAVDALTNPIVITVMIALAVLPMLFTMRIKPQPQPVYLSSDFSAD